MSSTHELLARIGAAFGRHPRPEHFTDWQHCCECAEHDQELASVTLDSISLRELGNPGWDPMCFATDDAYLYYFPAMARLATGRGDSYYLDQFLFHLGTRRLVLFSREQRELLEDFLWHLLALFADDPAILASDIHEIDRCLRELASHAEQDDQAAI